jgi:uncharacterized sulfatase
MDERYDCVRVVRDRRYRYLRNYLPHLPYMQHIAYMEEGWTMKELRRLQREGKLPPAARLMMSAAKPVEELYDAEADPHELRNLAEDPAHRAALERLRAEHERWSFETRDLGLIPEPIVDELGRRYGSRYAILRQPDSEQYLRRLRALVDAVNRKQNAPLVQAALADPDPAFRYWAVIGSEATPALLKDPHPVVRIAAAAKLRHVPALAAELAGVNPWARLQAAIALDELGPAAAPARAALEAARKDANEYVVRVAEHAVAQLG